MDLQIVGILDKIKEIHKSAADVFLGIGITDDTDFQDLTYDVIKDLLPGSTKEQFLTRSKVWKVISENVEPTKPRKDEESDPESSASSHLSNASTVLYLSGEDVPNPQTSQLRGPSYIMYTDEAFLAAEKAGHVPAELYHRLIRGTIHCMTSVSCTEPFNRYPNSAELEHMAKSIVDAHPILKDPETGHGKLFKQLKNRLKNTKPVKNIQGKCIAKQKKRKVLDYLTECTMNKKSNEIDETGSTTSESTSEFTEDVADEVNVVQPENDLSQSIMERHYSYLYKECRKKNPSPEVISIYLDKEFRNRRSWIKSLSGPDRCSQIMTKYPCFKEHVQIVEEVRRILAAPVKTDETYLNASTELFKAELDTIIYFGISHKKLPPPKPSLFNKVVYLIKSMHHIFLNKINKKKVPELLVEINAQEDPNKVGKNAPFPTMLIAGEEVIIVCNGTIITRFVKEEIVEAFVTYVGVYYLLDIDYPSSHELPLTIMQYIVFKDKSTPPDLVRLLDSVWKEYILFKGPNNF